MSSLEHLLASILVLIALIAGSVLGLQHYGAARFEAGRATAVVASEKLRQAESDRNREIESDLRAQLAARHQRLSKGTGICIETRSRSPPRARWR